MVLFLLTCFVLHVKKCSELETYWSIITSMAFQLILNQYFWKSRQKQPWIPWMWRCCGPVEFQFRWDCVPIIHVEKGGTLKKYLPNSWFFHTGLAGAFWDLSSEISYLPLSDPNFVVIPITTSMVLHSFAGHKSNIHQGLCCSNTYVKVLFDMQKLWFYSMLLPNTGHL